jgi:hypothetical protein
MAAGLRPPSLIFSEKFKIAGCSPCGSEVAQRISKRWVKRFKSYHIFKNPGWPPACGRHLGFFEILKLEVVALGGLKWPTKFQKERSNGLKVIIFSKIQDGRRPATAILDFFMKILKLQVVALVGLKWPTKFQKDRSNGLKVIIF